MTTRYFTFGSGQRNPETGESLDRGFVQITMPDDAPHDACRARMFRYFGPEWCAEREVLTSSNARRIEMPREQYDRGILGPEICAWMDANDPDMAPAKPLS